MVWCCKYQVAKNASAAAEGLCTWVRAMKFYHEASKIVKPKLEALAIAEGQMDAANKVRTPTPRGVLDGIVLPDNFDRAPKPFSCVLLWCAEHLLELQPPLQF